MSSELTEATRKPVGGNGATNTDSRIKKVLWTGKGGYRAVRFLGMAVIGTCILAAVHALTGGNGDPLELLKNNHNALLITVALGSAVAFYQLGNMWVNMYGVAMEKKITLRESAKPRLGVTIVVVAVIAAFLYLLSPTDNPIDAMQEWRGVFWATVAVTAGIVGSQVANVVDDTI